MTLRGSFCKEALFTDNGLHIMTKRPALSEAEISDIIQMALSDHDSFSQIQQLYGLPEKEVKVLMRSSLKRGSYQAWRKRVRQFSDRRSHYK
jgi:uncharacterized protein (TIGR03643 family)